MTERMVIDEMNKVDYRPASVFDILNLAINELGILKEFPIVAFGSIGERGGDYPVTCLYEIMGQRELKICLVLCSWGIQNRFVGVRKQPKPVNSKKSKKE